MNRIEHIAEGITLHLGDCREILPELSPVDCVVTSPPYAQQRDYGQKIQNWADVVNIIGRTPAHETTQILVNLGLVHKDGQVVPYWDPFNQTMMSEHGWRLFGWYVWDKCDGMGGDWHGRLAPAHEFIFHFNKAARPARKVVHSKLAGLVHKGNPGLRGADGKAKGYSHQGKQVQAFKIADSVIRIIPERTDYEATEHPAVFPVLLPQMLADSFSDPGETICDPFMGSGTTGIAALNIGRKFVGIEIEPKYFDLACKRIDAAARQQDMFVPKPAMPPAAIARD